MGTRILMVYVSLTKHEASRKYMKEHVFYIGGEPGGSLVRYHSLNAIENHRCQN